MDTWKTHLKFKNPGRTPSLVPPASLPSRIACYYKELSRLNALLRMLWNQKFKPSCHIGFSYLLNCIWLIWISLANNCDRITKQGSHKQNVSLVLIGWFVFGFCLFAFLPPLDPTFVALVFPPAGSAGWFHHPAMKQGWRFLVAFRSSHLVTFISPF